MAPEATIFRLIYLFSTSYISATLKDVRYLSEKTALGLNCNSRMLMPECKLPMAPRLPFPVRHAGRVHGVAGQRCVWIAKVSLIGEVEHPSNRNCGFPTGTALVPTAPKWASVPRSESPGFRPNSSPCALENSGRIPAHWSFLGYS